jgi:hypothetical protein
MNTVKLKCWKWVYTRRHQNVLQGVQYGVRGSMLELKPPKAGKCMAVAL